VVKFERLETAYMRVTLTCRQKLVDLTSDRKTHE